MRTHPVSFTQGFQRKLIRNIPMAILLVVAICYSVLNHLRSIEFADSLRQLRALERTSSALFFAGVEFKDATLNLLTDISQDPLTQERYLSAFENLHSQMIVAEARTEQLADAQMLKKLNLLMEEIESLHERIMLAQQNRADASGHVRILGFLIQRWLLQVEAINAAVHMRTIQSDAALDALQRTSLFVFACVLMITLAAITWMLNHWVKLKSEQRDREAFLHRMAEIDPLTGLLNRRGWERVRESLDNDPARVAAGVSLIVIDLDHFKRFNDLQGHAAGDALLTRFAQLLMTNSRPHDSVVRLGGEEFLLVLPHCNAQSADHLLSRLRSGLDMPVSFSAGVAEMKVGELATDALNRADRALYRAKHLGRSRTCLASPQPEAQLK